MRFGSSGIRGKTNLEISPQIALKFGNAVGNQFRNNSEIIIAHDTRVSATMIEMAVVSGLLSAGCRVTMSGVMPTPTLALASKQYDCGIMITASHNPAEYIGMKVFQKGMAFDTDQQNAVEQAINKDEYNYADWKQTGRLFTQDPTIAITSHKETILKHVKTSSLKVVLDCGCGAGSMMSPYLLRELGCNIVTLNSQPDGFFPGRDPEPRDDTLDILKKTVLSYGADIGIAHDADADRMMAVDNEGVFVSGDKLLTLFAMSESRTSISIPVDASRIVEDSLRPEIKVFRTKVGDMHIAESLKKNGGEFGGESSGAMIFPNISMCPDGIYATAKLLQIIESGGTFSDIISTIPQYPIKRGSYSYPYNNKKDIMIKIFDGLSSLGDIKINLLDGIRADLNDGWILIRLSGTEPKIRLTVESKSDDKRLFKLANDIIMGAVNYPP